MHDALILTDLIGYGWEHPDCVRAKHDRRQFISDNQRFTAVMLRPYEYICKIEMHSYGFRYHNHDLTFLEHRGHIAREYAISKST
jgi:hypothetical protein